MATTGSVTVLFYGFLQARTGVAKAEFPVSALADLRQAVRARYPEIGDHVYSVAVNGVVVREPQTLVPGDEVAFLPPFAGG